MNDSEIFWEVAFLSITLGRTLLIIVSIIRYEYIIVTTKVPIEMIAPIIVLNSLYLLSYSFI